MGLKERQAQLAEKRKSTGRAKNVPTSTPIKSSVELALEGQTPRKKRGIGVQRTNTPVKLSQEAKDAIAIAQTTEEVQVILDTELPKGYTAIGKNDLPKLLKLKQNLIDARLASFDYETDGDPDDETQDPQDHNIVGVSFAYEVGQAFYMPIGHVSYGANWDIKWFTDNFLRPILEHPEVAIIAHNIQFEHQISMLYEIDMLPKAMARMTHDTMLMLKMLALPQSVNELGEVVLGLKPNTKALLADSNGFVNGLLHVDDIQTFKETVGKVEWLEPIPGEFYKSGAKKGQPKTKKKARTRNFGELPVDKHTVDYGCSDSDWALALYHKLLPIMEAEGLLDTYHELNIPFAHVVGEYELTGWHVNKQRLYDMEALAYTALYGHTDVPDIEAHKSGNVPSLEGSINYQLQEALIELCEDVADIDEDGNVIVPAGVYGMGEWRNNPVSLEIKTSKPFSWGSTQHKQWLFFRVLRMDTRGLKRSTTTGLPGTGKENWDKLVEGYTGDNKFMSTLKERNKYDKLLSTYIHGMLPFVREDTSKLHTNLRLVSTWRLASKKPNLQNIPRADNDPMGIRGVFVAPDYDPKADYSTLNICTRPTILLSKEALRGTMVYVNADYSQIELRVLAWYANEANMIQAFWDGHDFHSATAHDVWNLDCTIDEVASKYKPFRYRAKAINFGIVYGLTEYGLSDSIKVSVAEAKQTIDQYFIKYPGVKQYANDQIAFAREHGYVQTIFGNRRPIPEINHSNKWLRQAGENKAMNTPIQGSASDVIKVAMVNIQKETRKPENSYLKAVMQIHDEIQGESPIEYALEGAMLLKNTMEQPIEGLSGIIPIKADPAIGRTWNEALDIKFDSVTGKAYVTPKKEKKEATDVTFEEVEYMLDLYDLAGIEVRVPQ